MQIPANQHAEVVDVKSAKTGRRNSAADEQSLREVLDKLQDITGEVAEAQSIVNGLLADAAPEPTEEPAKANAEEPEKANAEEPRRNEAELRALLDEAEKFLI